MFTTPFPSSHNESSSDAGLHKLSLGEISSQLALLAKRGEELVRREAAGASPRELAERASLLRSTVEATANALGEVAADLQPARVDPDADLRPVCNDCGGKGAAASKRWGPVSSPSAACPTCGARPVHSLHLVSSVVL